MESRRRSRYLASVCKREESFGVIHLRIEPVTSEAFEPFGQLLPPGAPGESPQALIKELHNGRASARPRLSMAAVEPKALPLTAAKMERHAHSSQAFVPMDCASYLVMVAPPQVGDGKPDLSRLRAFRVPGDTGINYRPDIWHHPLSPLERAGRFAVLTFIDGTAGDEDWADLPQPVVVGA
jgi:ureidoglycolate lyase